MSKQYVVFVDDGPWRLVSIDSPSTAVVVPFSDDAAVEDRVAAVMQQLAAVHATDEPLVLALPSAWCLSAAISTEALDRTSRRQAMGYRLEEHLPIAAEDVVADYVRLDDSKALGVCAELSRLQPLVGAFEVAGLNVRHICPAALLAAAFCLDHHALLDGVLISGTIGEAAESAAGKYDFIELQGGKPARWWWFAEDEVAVRERLASWATPEGARKRLAVIGCPPATHERLVAPWPIEAIEVEIDGQGAAASRAAAMMKTDSPAWIDLRSGPLAAADQSQEYRTPVVGLVAAVVLLLVCLIGILVWRGHQYDILRQRAVQQQAGVFRDVMPGQSVPGSIKNRLSSERRKLAGLGGSASEETQAASLESVSALVQLRDVLAHLPTQLRYRIVDLGIQPDLVRVEGEAQNYAEAESIAVALRQAGIYDVESPKTQALKGQGVSFLFSASPRTAAKGDKR